MTKKSKSKAGTDIDDVTSSYKKQAIKNKKSRYEDMEDYLLLDLDDIEEVYTCKVNGSTWYIVKTSKGCFNLDLAGLAS